MCWFESNQSEPIRFIVNRRQYYATLLELLAMQMLKANLNEFNRIFGLNLAQVKYNQVKHLLHLHGIFFVFVLF